MGICVPGPIQRGARVGLVAPAGACRAEDAVDRAIAAVEAQGFFPITGESCRRVYGYLSGSDEVRAKDINTMFQSRLVDAVFCIRGGYGAPRILPLLDYEMIAQHPKPFLGYSDVTALHAALFRRCGLMTFHGPMPASDWIQEGFDDFSRAHLARMLTRPVQGPLINPQGYPLRTVSPGRASGRLVGGNLSLVSGLCGTPWAVEPAGNILFLEDVGEKTYKLDHMLTQLRNAGYFDACAGVVFGEFTDCELEYPEFALDLREIIADIVAPCKKPILAGLRAGHCQPTLTLPLGARVTLDADARELVVDAE